MWISGELWMSCVLLCGILYGSVTRRNRGVLELGVLLCGIVMLNNEMSGVVYGYELDGVNRVGKGLVMCGGALCVLRRQKEKEVERMLLVGLSILGVVLLTGSKDLLLMYLGIELSGLGWSVLVSSGRSGYSIEGGLKYFVVGSVGSVLILLGLGTLYSTKGTVDLVELELLGVEGVVSKLGVVCLLLGVSLKLGSAPYHEWLVDVYEGARSDVSKMMSIVPKVGLVIMLVRMNGVVEEGGLRWVLEVLCVVTFMIGGFGSMKQVRTKRFLGYSGVGNVGYMLLGAGILEEVMVFMAIYVVMTWMSWEIVEKRGVKYIEELGSSCRKNGVLGLVVIVTMFGVAGIPPLAGFMGKLSSLMGGAESGMYSGVVGGVLLSVIGSYYYTRMIKVGVYEAPKGVIFVGKRLEGELLGGSMLGLLCCGVVLNMW